MPDDPSDDDDIPDIYAPPIPLKVLAVMTDLASLLLRALRAGYQVTLSPLADQWVTLDLTRTVDGRDWEYGGEIDLPGDEGILTATVRELVGMLDGGSENAHVG